MPQDAFNSDKRGVWKNKVGSGFHHRIQPSLHVILNIHTNSMRSPASGFDIARSISGRTKRKYGNAVINQAASCSDWAGDSVVSGRTYTGTGVRRSFSTLWFSNSKFCCLRRSLTARRMFSS